MECRDTRRDIHKFLFISLSRNVRSYLAFAWRVRFGEFLMLVAYDPETVALLRTTLDETWDSLRADVRARSSKTLLASHILELAKRGERNPWRLRTYAVLKARDEKVSAQIR